MYRAKLPKTKFLSPYPSARFTGTVTVGDDRDRARRLARDDRPQLGRRARRALGLDPGVGPGRQRGRLPRHRGGPDQGRRHDHAVGRQRLHRARRRAAPNRRLPRDVRDRDRRRRRTPASSRSPGKGINVKGRVSAPAKDFVAWIYADPKGPEHNTLNCSISDMELKVERAGERHAHLDVAGAAAYEFGTRDTRPRDPAPALSGRLARYPLGVSGKVRGDGAARPPRARGDRLEDRRGRHGPLPDRLRDRRGAGGRDRHRAGLVGRRDDRPGGGLGVPVRLRADQPPPAAARHGAARR